jgi:hypothetical protein
MTDTEILDYLQKRIEEVDARSRKDGIARRDWAFGVVAVHSRKTGESRHIRELLAEKIEADVADAVARRLLAGKT